MTTLLLAFAALAALAATMHLAACASEGDSAPARPSVPPAFSPAEAAALRNLDRSLVTCAGDTACPHGSHCALGACAYECASDADCLHGRRCDPTGRCR